MSTPDFDWRGYRSPTANFSVLKINRVRSEFGVCHDFPSWLKNVIGKFLPIVSWFLPSTAKDTEMGLARDRLRDEKFELAY